MRKLLNNLKIILWFCTAFLLALSACQYPQTAPQATQEESDSLTPTLATFEKVLQPVVQELAPTATPDDLPTTTPTPLLTATSSSEPTSTAKAEGDTAALSSNAGINPLTNQPCQDPSLLNLPPALVSVSNFPVTARPQAGLSYASYVFELFIGEGMTRFLALFYCAFPEETVSGDNTIGPVRSGRLPYESLRKLYNGFLIMASASGEVKAQLGDSSNVFGSDPEDINSALVAVSKLKAIVESQAGKEPPNLSGNVFDPNPPAEGMPADRLWVFYSFLNQVMWTYNPGLGAYLRAQDNADGSGQFTPSVDRLNGEPLAFENVIVLFAEHEVLNSEGTLIDVNLLYTRGKAYLFRDGVMLPIRWSTISEAYEKESGKLRPLRFVDAQGNPVALKPGRVWVEFVHLTTTISEVEPGMWKVRFYAP